ncbi:MAG: dimethyl sulfoxide reductase anchor subunit family protein, partial [Pauljensenia sp.]
MNVSDVPMVLFTVITQMCVGAFVTLGVIQLVASLRHDPTTVERVTHPVLYAIGPAMIFGLAVSTFHMHDPLHALNVIRHWDSSWLSREIIFGCSFAGLGFLFAILEWFRKGSFALRRALAVLTALMGIALVIAESMIYYSLTTVPAWHTWGVPLHFAGTTLILGSLAVACALMVTT